MSVLGDIQAALRRQHYRISRHGARELAADAIDEPDLVASTLAGEVVEDYPDAFPFPACLVLGFVEDGSPIHAVWAHDPGACYAVLVTAYRPEAARWTPDFRKRVKP